MAKILCTGIVTLDIVNTVSHYPLEDEELRASEQDRRQGGNAANTANMLAQHSDDVSLLSVIADDADGQWLARQLGASGINTDYCPTVSGTTPTSYITRNQKTGSRTIVHYRDLPEMSYAQFEQVDLKAFDTFHFEGRNIDALEKMLQRCRKIAPETRISLEVEKARDDIETLFDYADVLMISKDYANKRGYDNAEACLSEIDCSHPDKLMSCTWGSNGVFVRSASGDIQHIRAENHGAIRDTVGAGDTFNAGLIHSLCRGKNFTDAAQYANNLAAKKITQAGFNGLVAAE